MKQLQIGRSRNVIIFFIFAFVILGGAAFSQGADYPTKPIKLYVPYGAGGSTDIAARMLVSVIPEFLGQPVVVVNKPGAAGSVCFDFVRKEKADGYSMMMDSIGATILYAAMNPKLPFSYDQHTYIARVEVLSNALVVKPDAPWKTFAELVEYLKANPGKSRYSTAGVGTTQHLGGVVMLEELGLPASAAEPVHYDSSAAAVLAVMQGEVDFCLNNFPAVGAQLKAGKLRGLAVTNAERIDKYPDIPTFTELGYPGIDTISWIGVGGPPGLSETVVKKWEEAVSQSCNSKAWIKMVENLEVTSSFMGHKEMTEYVNREFKRYRKLYEELGLLMK